MYWKGCTLIYKMSVIRHRVVLVLFRYWPIQNGMDRPNDSSARLMLGPPVTSSSTKDQKAIRKLKMGNYGPQPTCLVFGSGPLTINQNAGP